MKTQVVIFALVTAVLAGCATVQTSNADGRYLIERDASGTPIRQMTWPNLEACRGALHETLAAARLFSRAGLSVNKYRCEQFGVFGLRYRGEFSCDDCEFQVSIAARTVRECEISIENLKSGFETLFANVEGISMDHPDFQKYFDEEFKITECQLHRVDAAISPTARPHRTVFYFPRQSRAI
ncbi:MAG: hypothetical protein OXU61_07885 [Gammaproteobacteria bacterium]|nr:hypothetical protein [Gammaproteobacteria bacterium]MDD9818034.1 hypothetical protein [Gammaproteobacteria bacterium]